MSNTSMNTEYGLHRDGSGNLQNLRSYLNTGFTPGVVPFDTIPDLLLTPPLENTLVQTKGYNVIGDNKESLYVVLSGTAQNSEDVQLTAQLYAKRLSDTETVEETTWYVDPIQGTDSLEKGFGPGVNAVRTLQYAYDRIPSIVKHQQTIQLADGVYNTNYLTNTPTVELPRPAILFAREKFICARTEKVGNDLIGGIVIKGNQSNPQNVIIAPNDTFNYGIYNAQGQLAIQDLVIRPEAGSTNIVNLLISHRMDSRIHTVNVSLDGRDKNITSRGLITESGGSIEFTTTTSEARIENCAILASTLTAGDRITIAGNYKLDNANTGILSQSNSEVKLSASGITGQTITNCSDQCINAIFGGYVSVRGANTSGRTTIDGRINIESGGIVDFVWVNTTDLVLNTEGTIKLDTCDYQDQLNIRGGDLWIRNTNSFISPETENDNSIPIALTFGARAYKEGTNNIIGLGGGYASRNPQTLNYTANNQIVSIVDSSDVYRIFGNGANRTNCQINSQDVEEGRVIYLDGDSWGVELVSGAHMDIPVPFTLGNSVGQYTGAIFTLRNGLWRLNSLGQERV